MVGEGIETVGFEEELTGPPKSVSFLAGACFAGFRLRRPPEPNVENLLLGKERLPQFRDAKRAELRRVVLYHFYSRRVRWHGDLLRVGEFRELWCSDRTTRRVVEASPVYGRWLAGFVERFADLPLVALAEEADRHCYGRIGGDARALRDFHFFMEEGFE